MGSLARLLRKQLRGVTQACTETEVHMPGLTIAFLIIAVGAGVAGFTGLAGGPIGVAKIIFAIFSGLFVILLIFRRAAKAKEVRRQGRD